MSATNRIAAPSRTVIADEALTEVARLLRGVLTDALRDAVEDIKNEIRSTIAFEVSTRREKRAVDGELLTVDHVAGRLNVRPATVREWIRSGYLSAVQVGPAGRRYGVRPDDLERLLAKSASDKKPMDRNDLAIQIVKSARSRGRGRKE